MFVFGKRDENGFWTSKNKRFRFMFRGHDSLYIAFYNFRFRLMKPRILYEDYKTDVLAHYVCKQCGAWHRDKNSLICEKCKEAQDEMHYR